MLIGWAGLNKHHNEAKRIVANFKLPLSIRLPGFSFVCSNLLYTCPVPVSILSIPSKFKTMITIQGVPSDGRPDI